MLRKHAVPVARESAIATSSGRRIWYVGGGLLLGAGLAGITDLTLAPTFGDAYFVPQIIGMALFSAGILVLAWGGRGSVVSRRPVGLIALSLLAGIPPLLLVLAVFGGLGDRSLPLLQWGIVLAGAVGVVEIARIGAVPGRWRWLPAICWVLTAGLLACVLIAPQVLTAVSGPTHAELLPFAVWRRVTPVVSLILGGAAIGLAGVAGRRAHGQAADPRSEPDEVGTS